MGKTIIVKDITKCNTCKAKEKFGCYLSVCNNCIQTEDNKKTNKLIYKQGESP